MELSASAAVIPADLLAQRAGSAPAQIAPQSHYRDPLVYSGGLNGRSRRWGDATPAVQRAAIQALLAEARKLQLPQDAAALLLAIARTESGFNPDAAAGVSSASGLGQFVDSTASAYGITPQTRFSLSAGARALTRLTLENYRRATKLCRRAAEPDCRAAYTYALHHDGPSLKHGGLEIAHRVVLPWQSRFARALDAAQTAGAPPHPPHADLR